MAPAMVLGMAACSPSRTAAPRTPLEIPAVDGAVPVATRTYHAMGLAASSGPVPFVGRVAYFATSRPDSTLSLFSVSLANRSLTFGREGDRYRASYGVQLSVRQGGAEVRRTDGLELVRIASFRETARTDESVIFQRWLRLAPGSYTLHVAVRDVGSNGVSSDSIRFTVPRLATRSLSTPLHVYEAGARRSVDSIPQLLAGPRSTAVFGRDSLFGVYVEAYGGPSESLPLRATLRNESGVVTWTEAVSIPRRGALHAGLIHIPVGRAPVGVSTLSLARSDGGDSSASPVFITFGDDLPVAPFEEILSYLRYFASSSRIRAMRDAPVEQRPALWAQFLRETDPSPSTPVHEGLQEYFSRIQQANLRYRSEAVAGWLSDRGSVYVSLGDPDEAVEQVIQPARNRLGNIPIRVQAWDYRRYNVRLIFTDEDNPGRFRLTPASAGDFRSINQRRLQ